MQRNWWIRSHSERCFFSQWHRWLGIKIRMLPREVEILTSVLFYTSPDALPRSDKRLMGAKATRLGLCDKQSLQMISPKPVNLPISNFTAPWIWSVVVKLHKRILPSERDKIMSIFHFLGHLIEGEQVWGREKWRWDDKAARSVAANPCLVMKLCLASYKMSILQCWYSDRVNLFQATR